MAMSEMSETSSQDPLYEYKLQKKEEFEGRNLMRVGTHHVLQDDVYTTLEPSDSTPGSFYHGVSTGNRRVGNFLVPNYSNFSASEATSTALFFGFQRETKENNDDVCSGVSQGILSFINDHNNLDDRSLVTAVLNRDTLKLLKGNNEFMKIQLSKISPPILILPNSNECLKIHSGKDPLILCSFNEYSRDSWWMQLTKQILCNNRGPTRNEVYGESSIEEQAEDLEHLFNKEEKTGINIHIDGKETELPQIKVHYKS